MYIRSKHHDASILVGVHVRRGDYFTEAHASGGRLHTAKFFTSAMEKMVKHLGVNNSDIVFIVASDSPKWTTAHIASKHFNIIHTGAYFNSHPLRVPWVNFDFAVLSSCDHSIYDYGTFGFWTSYLAGGQVGTWKRSLFIQTKSEPFTLCCSFRCCLPRPLQAHRKDTGKLLYL